MSKRLDAIMAVKALVQRALPGCDVLCLENDAPVPERIPPNGRVIIFAGDPGTPQVDLSPVIYNYEHAIPLSIAAYQTGDRSLTAEDVVDSMVGRISDEVVADRTAGGVVDYLDGYAPETADLFAPGAEPARTADLTLLATYSTTKPL